MLGRWVLCPGVPANQHIILKIDGFKVARAAVMLWCHGPRIVLRVLLRLFSKLVVKSSNWLSRWFYSSVYFSLAPKWDLKFITLQKTQTNSHSDTWNHGLIPRAGEASSLQLKTFQQWCKMLERLKYPVRWDCLISPWRQSWERDFHKHKCIQFIARVLVENPFPRLSPWRN